MNLPNKKDMFWIFVWSGIIASWWLTANTFFAIWRYGAVTYYENNLYILGVETVLTFIFGFIYLFVGINYLVDKTGGKE